jgi:hypothetical protein
MLEFADWETEVCDAVASVANKRNAPAGCRLCGQDTMRCERENLYSRVFGRLDSVAKAVTASFFERAAGVAA